MKELTKKELEKLKKIELEILKEFDRICRKNDIKYSLAYGNLIGAVRHGGFIPWDDDIDVMMERPQYQRFIAVVDTELDNRFEFIDAERDPYYGHMFGKIMARNTLMREVSLKKNKSKAGVFIDIFPLDIVPNDEAGRKRQRNIAQSVQKILLCRGNYYFQQNKIKFIVYRCFGLICRLIPKKFFCTLYFKNAVKYSKNEYCDGITNLAGFKTIFARKYFDDYIDIKYENEMIMSIKQSDRFLIDRYGDYMTLPPMSERIPHHYVCELDLHEWEI